jgi:hypothetical protein
MSLATPRPTTGSKVATTTRIPTKTKSERTNDLLEESAFSGGIQTIRNAEDYITPRYQWKVQFVETNKETKIIVAYDHGNGKFTQTKRRRLL